MAENTVRVAIVGYGNSWYDGSEIWVDQKRVFDSADGVSSDVVGFIAEAICEAVRALGNNTEVKYCNWDDISDLASPFCVADSNGCDIEEDIATFDEAVTIADRLAKSDNKVDDKILAGYEVINRFGNSVYKIEEE